MNTILIIEDEPQIRENIEQILDLEGYTTIVAEDGRQGLEMVGKHCPDMIICDLMMPNLDGYGVIEELRKNPITAEIPLVFLTAKAEHKDLRQAMGMGADDYLTKPFELHELLQVVYTQLKKRQLVTQRYTKQIQDMETQIKYLAGHDSFTGLPNQLLLEEHFNRIRLKAYKQGQFLPLLMIDINVQYHTKFFLDSTLKYLLLKEVAEQLQEINYPHQIIDLISYLKTDKLALLLNPVHDHEMAAKIAEQILDILSNPVTVNNQEISVQAKIGIACYPQDALQLGELLTHAELTLEHYKLDDTKSYYFYDQEIFKTVFRKVILESDFLPALERDEFLLYYQPQIDIKTGKTVGVEALIRWRHPEYGIVSPAEFIPIAEESGLIIPLGEWVIKTACSQLKDLQIERFGKLKVAVNISACQFTQENFIDRVNDIITQNDFPAERLELELTETVFIQDIELAKRKMNTLMESGIQLSIDDFGTGYSSFKYLQEFCFNHLKIDRYFITNIDKLQNKQSIVKSIIQLAQNLNIQIVAEGVETHEELNWLKQNNCDIVQGYFFSRPLSVEDLRIFLLAKN